MATYNKNVDPKENDVLVYNEASELMEWATLNKSVDKTYIDTFIADSGQTLFNLQYALSIDSVSDKVFVFVNGDPVEFNYSGSSITLLDSADSGDKVGVSRVPDSAEHLGVIYWHKSRNFANQFDGKYDSVRWGTLVDLVDSSPTRHQDVPMYDSDTRRMTWGRAPTMASAIFAIDTSDINTTPPAGSYVSGYGTVSGGGFEASFAMEEGVIYGPTDGTQITVSGSPGDYFLVTQPV